eukprot:4448912-Amphidinium_carterae.1
MFSSAVDHFFGSLHGSRYGSYCGVRLSGNLMFAECGLAFLAILSIVNGQASTTTATSVESRSSTGSHVAVAKTKY